MLSGNRSKLDELRMNQLSNTTENYILCSGLSKLPMSDRKTEKNVCYHKMLGSVTIMHAQTGNEQTCLV